MTISWTGIEPGDIGFDRGGGFVGFLIRHFSHSPYAHCWVYHYKYHDADIGKDMWKTLEAYPGGLKYRDREVDRVHRVARIWRNTDERSLLLGKSEELAGSGYNYKELFRIIHYRVRKIALHLLFIYLILVFGGYLLDIRTLMAMSYVAIGLLFFGALPFATHPDSAKLTEGRVICSNHVAQCVLNARPDVKLTYPPQLIWPGRLEQDLNLITWHDWRRNAGS